MLRELKNSFHAQFNSMIKNVDSKNSVTLLTHYINNKESCSSKLLIPFSDSSIMTINGTHCIRAFAKFITNC